MRLANATLVALACLTGWQAVAAPPAQPLPRVGPARAVMI